LIQAFLTRELAEKGQQGLFCVAATLLSFGGGYLWGGNGLAPFAAPKQQQRNNTHMNKQAKGHKEADAF
jgi:hypothetical protein